MVWPETPESSHFHTRQATLHWKKTYFINPYSRNFTVLHSHHVLKYAGTSAHGSLVPLQLPVTYSLIRSWTLNLVLSLELGSKAGYHQTERLNDIGFKRLTVCLSTKIQLNTKLKLPFSSFCNSAASIPHLSPLSSFIMHSCSPLPSRFSWPHLADWRLTHN